MIFSHKDYLTYELPNDWCSEDEEENLLIYNPNGEGAITVSFFNILELREAVRNNGVVRYAIIDGVIKISDAWVKTR